MDSEVHYDRTLEMQRFVERMGFRRIAPGRCSTLLAFQLFLSWDQGVLNPHKVMREIEGLECKLASRTKPASRFVGEHLRGLWHKHYLPDGISSIAHNIRLALKEHGLPWFEEQVRQAVASGEERYLTPDMIATLVNDAVDGNLRRRAEAGKLTGEWIIFAVHEKRNYYLSLGYHAGDDRQMRQQILDFCAPQFPFLATLLNNAGGPG